MLDVQRSCIQRQKQTPSQKNIRPRRFRGPISDIFDTRVASYVIAAVLDRIVPPRPCPELTCKLDHPDPPITAFSVPPKTARNGHFPKWAKIGARGPYIRASDGWRHSLHPNEGPGDGSTRHHPRYGRKMGPAGSRGPPGGHFRSAGSAPGDAFRAS